MLEEIDQGVDGRFVHLGFLLEVSEAKGDVGAVGEFFDAFFEEVEGASPFLGLCFWLFSDLADFFTRFGIGDGEVFGVEFEIACRDPVDLNSTFLGGTPPIAASRRVVVGVVCFFCRGFFEESCDGFFVSLFLESGEVFGEVVCRDGGSEQEKGEEGGGFHDREG